MRKLSLAGAVGACLIGSSFSSNAALVTGDVLEFVPGTQICTIGGTPPLCDSGVSDIAGSYFAMDINANGSFDVAEKFPISMNEGIRIGVAQPASGSHSGAPDGSETPSIDNPWQFSGNTGMHSTTSPVTELSPGVLDFSGWIVNWNGIVIAMGGDAGAGDTGLAAITCSIPPCSVNDTYVLDYFSHVPQPDPSGKGGVYYSLHLEGTIAAIPLPAAVWLFGSGLFGLAGMARRKCVIQG
jgi:hypothetical protein